jgi:ABC-2 type transport system permease protein
LSLYKAETRRLVKRRLIRYSAIAALVLLAAIAVGTFVTNQHVGPAERAAAVQQAKTEFANEVTRSTELKASCEKAKGTAEAGNFPPCDQITPPTEDSFQPEWYLPSTFNFRSSFGNMITAFAGIMAMVGFVIGASFVGAEWNSGGMMNLLLWRPQRLKVLTTKLSALLVGITSLSLVTGALWTGAFWLTAVLRGTTEKMTPGTWASFGLMGLRGLVLILVGTIIGFALASLGRHTAMAMGVAIGFVVLMQFGLVTVLSMANVKFLEAWILPTWGSAWMNQSYKIEDYNVCNASPTGECKPDTMILTWHEPGYAMLIGVVLILGAALWTMRSRDVT